ELEEREKSRKMLKHKETPQNMSAEVNNTNRNILLQQTEQTEMDIHTQFAEVTVTDNKDTSKQSWDEMTDNNSNNLKDITNATNPWVIPSTSKTYAEQISTESDISYNKIERTLVGLEGLTDNCFFKNIDDMIGLSEWKTEDKNPYGLGSTSTNEEIKNAREPNLYPDYKHEDMQTDVALHVTQAESNESAINEERTHEK
ncbi:8613_t:CDS:2, partial [Gigaspora margarita]